MPLASQDINSYLDSFINYELQTAVCPEDVFRLDRVVRLLEALGNPHRRLRCVHIAGTKGKGSACAFLAHILKKSGLRVGLYTSPHFAKLNERIRLLSLKETPGQTDGIFSDAITDEELRRVTDRTRPVLEKFRLTEKCGALTWFEALTALAFCYFDQAHTDVVVLETGMGGRLDATNVVDPLACGITSISLDHTQQLGATLEAVAKEKAAIIKKDKPVVIAPQAEEAMEVIRARCGEMNARACYVGKDLTCQMSDRNLGGQRFIIRGARREYDVGTRLLGDHQMINAAMAVGLAEILKDEGFAISDEAIEGGMSETFWPGRFEIMGRDPCFVLDAAHNPDSMAALRKTVEDYFAERKKILVLGLSRDKDIRGIYGQLQGFADRVIPARADHPRAYDFSDDNVRQELGISRDEKVRDIAGALEAALSAAGENDCIVVTGSLFAVAQAREILKKERSINA